MRDLFNWCDPRRPTGVLVLLLPSVVMWTGLYWLADAMLPLIGAWTHLAVPAGVVVLAALVLRAVRRRQP